MGDCTVILRTAIITLMLATLTAGASQQQEMLMRRAYGARGTAVSSGFWTPSNTTTVLWLDAQDYSTFSNKAPTAFVVKWNDKSGLDNSITNQIAGVGYESSVYIPDDGNGYASVSNGNDWALGGVFRSSITGTNVSVFVVANNLSGGSGAGRLFCVAASGDTTASNDYTAENYGSLLLKNGVGSFGAYRANSYRSTYSAGASISNNALYCSQWMQGTNNVWFNGNAGTTNTYSGNFNFGRYFIFYGGTAFWKGRIYEACMTTNVLTTTDRQKFEGYLAWKYKLTNSLPADHPYKSARPTQ